MRTARDYQQECVAAVDREFGKVNSTLAVMATGLGKTVVMSEVAKHRSKSGAVLMLAHRVELLDQAAEHFSHELGYMPEIIQGNRDVDWHGIGSGNNVIIGSVQTLKNPKRLERLKKYGIGTILIDEAHHAVARSYRTIVDFFRGENAELKTLGVTATPKRTDKKAAGLVFESVAFQMEASDGIKKGWLVEPIEERVIIDNVDFGEVPITFNELGEPDFSPSALEALMIEEGPLHAVATPTIARSDGRSVLVFTAGVAHAHLLAAILNRMKPGSAAAVDGKTTPPGHPERNRIMSDFRQGKIQYVCNFGLLTEGTDVPTCDMVVVARPTKSVLILTQMVGRGLRPLPGVVDGHTLPTVRRAAISESAKPTALILYFSPRAANIKTATTYDALGGNYDDDVVTLAKELDANEPGKKVTDRLEEAALLYPVIAQNKLRKKIKAEVEWRTEAVGNNQEYANHNVSNIQRGGATDKQIESLIALGVSYQEAAKFTAKQAWTVTDKLRQERCTVKQRSLLERFGQDPNVNYHQARELIDAIAKNGWKPL